YLNIGVTINEKDSHAEKWIPIIRIGIGLGLFESLLGELMWQDNDTVLLYQKNKRDYWEIDTEKDTVVFHYPRAEKGDPHGQYDYAKMYIDGWLVAQDFDMAVQWLKKSAAQGFGRAVKLLNRIQAGEDIQADPINSSLK
ncbi:MAG: SEL1-like repeat protein, partial [Peptococcaceae bacterium]|nr:SEL1-like repeat protein [Peptococcaceae bacterium]